MSHRSARSLFHIKIDPFTLEMNAVVDLHTARALAASERWFDLLGLSPYASEEDTKRACRAARVSTHPHRGHDQLELAQIVNHAADHVMSLVAKPFALYETHVGSEAPHWALGFEAALALDRRQRNWEAFEHHLELYRRRVEQTVTERERARAETARQERLRLAEVRARKNARAALLRRLNRGFTPNGYCSSELAVARRERIRLKRRGVNANAEMLAAADARVAAALANARREFSVAQESYQQRRFPANSASFAASNPDAAVRLRTLHQRFRVHSRARSRSSDGLARSAEIAEVLRDAWALVAETNTSDPICDNREHQRPDL